MSLDAASMTLLAQVRRRGIPRFCHLTPSLARQASNAGIRTSSEPVAAIETFQIDRPDGTSFAVRFVVPTGEVAGTVVYLHGGGWVVGSVDQAEPVARRLANRSGCAVALPDYSLAPERPYPCALDDAWRALAAPGDLKSAPGVAPLRADSLAGLPPLLLVQADHDVLFDEGAHYATAVAAAGVPVTRRIFEGQMHGFFTLFDLLPAGEAAVDFVAAEIRTHLGKDRKWTV